MATALERLLVVIGADTQNYNKEMAKFEKSIDRTTEKIGRFGAMMSAAITVPLIAAAGGLLKMAMSAVESENLFEVSMGGMANSARAWSEQLRKDLGLNAYEIRKNTGMFYTMFESMKLGSADAYTLSTGLTQLAYDMASFYNLPGGAAEAFEKLRAGITGEAEPLKQLGIIVMEETVKQYAYANGIAAVGAELSEQQKVMARYGVIMSSTSKAQGDLARTADSPTNKLRIMSERAKQLGTDIGMSLIPVLNDLITIAEPLAAKIERIIKAFNALDPATRKNIIAGFGLLAVTGPLALALAAITTVVGKVISGIGTLIKFAGTARLTLILLQTGSIGLGGALSMLAGGPVGVIILAIGALITAGVLLYQNWDKIKYYGLQAFAILKNGALNSLRLMLVGIEKFLGWIPGIGEKIREAISGLELKISDENIAFNARAAVYAVRDLTDETNRYAEAQKRANNVGAELSYNTDMSKMGKYAPAGGDKEKDIKSATKWINTSEALINVLNILRSQHEATALKAEMHSDKMTQMSLKGKQLNEQLTAQQAIVAKVKEEIEANTAAGVLQDETQEDLAKRTDELNKKLADEEKALVDLEKQVYDNNQAIKTQAAELRDLAQEVTKVEKKYKDDLAGALEDYQKKSAEVSKKLIDDERKVTDEYEKSLDSRTRSLRDFVGLFDAVSGKEVSGADLLKNLRGQVGAFENWSTNISQLAARGVDEGLIAELREMGPKAGPEIAALTTLTDSELQEYVNLWRQKNEDARAEAVTQLQQQKVEMQTKLMEIRAAATEQLELYRVEWEKKNADIRKNADEEMARIQKKFEDVAGAGTTYGVKLVSNFTAGMESQFEGLRKTLEAMAGMVDSYMPHSPAKVGPLKRLAEWGPSLVKSLTEGIKAEMPRLSTVTADMAAAIRSPVVNVAPAPVAVGGGRGIVIENINIHGNNAEEIWSKFERKLALKGWR